MTDEKDVTATPSEHDDIGGAAGGTGPVGSSGDSGAPDRGTPDVPKDIDGGAVDAPPGAEDGDGATGAAV
ncbi:MAG: hypothetical protein QOC93_3904 [Actinomycetota bacterium]|jgi:hypothetical protein|nr:hypothetical protein [Cryptosporangiaceae bacterium]MDQ1678760.1 hypothetical protein [Actinomycetota bacterium]